MFIKHALVLGGTSRLAKAFTIQILSNPLWRVLTMDVQPNQLLLTKKYSPKRLKEIVIEDLTPDINTLNNLHY